MVCRTSRPWAFADTTSACATAGIASADRARYHFISGAPHFGESMARRRLAVEDRVDLRRHLFDGRHPVDPAHQAALFVIREDRLGLGAIFGHPAAHRRLIVVREADELGSATLVAHAFGKRPGIFVVIWRAAICTGEAADDAMDERVLLDLELDHIIEAPATLGEQQVERL